MATATTDDSVSNQFENAFGDLKLEKLTGFSRIEAAQISMVSLLQNETARLEAKLGPQHPRTLQLKARLQSTLDAVHTLQVQQQLARIEVPEIAENDGLVHGRVVDEDDLGIDNLLVVLVDQSGKPVRDTSEAATDESGYFAIPLDSSNIDRLTKEYQNGIFLAVFTPRRRLVHQEAKPLALSKGSRLLVEVKLFRSDLTATPCPPEVNVTVPNVVDLTESEAIARLEKAGLKLGLRKTKVAPDQAGRVLDQNPAAGTKVEQHSSVSLTIGVQSGTITVPSVLGKTLRHAKKQIPRTGLAVGRISGPAANDSIVQDQDPKPDTDVEAGTLVNLVVVAGPAEPRELDVTKDAITELVERMAADKGFANIGASANKLEKLLKKNGITTKEQIGSLLKMSDKDLKANYRLPTLKAARAFKRVLGKVLRSN